MKKTFAIIVLCFFGSLAICQEDIEANFVSVDYDTINRQFSMVEKTIVFNKTDKSLSIKIVFNERDRTFWGEISKTVPLNMSKANNLTEIYQFKAIEKDETKEFIYLTPEVHIAKITFNHDGKKVSFKKPFTPGKITITQKDIKKALGERKEWTKKIKEAKKELNEMDTKIIQFQILEEQFDDEEDAEV